MLYCHSQVMMAQVTDGTSTHAIGLHMSLCDGSVQFINYSINPFVFSYLSNRHDGMTIDGKKF
ncbi:MAG: DUF1559 domain-containing protein [Pirellulales bacterium]|nr:DUF1559 domain-containing protein [Pirellulales bacterium]